MNDFLHCNQCFALPEKITTKFWLTTCSHIFCTSCSQQISKDSSSCLKCKSRCNLIALDSTIKPEIRSYFEPIGNLLAKLSKVERFQQAQRANLRRYLTTLTSKGQVSQEKWEKRVSDLRKEIHLLRNRLGQTGGTMKQPSSSSSFRDPQHPQMTSSSLITRSSLVTFNQPSRLDPVTPMVSNRIISLDSPLSRGSSKLTLRSSSSLSGYRAR